VGGPSDQDVYVDDCKDYQKNEVATDYNAGITGAVVAMAAAVFDPTGPPGPTPSPSTTSTDQASTPTRVPTKAPTVSSPDTLTASPTKPPTRAPSSTSGTGELRHAPFFFSHGEALNSLILCCVLGFGLQPVSMTTVRYYGSPTCSTMHNALESFHLITQYLGGATPH